LYRRLGGPQGRSGRVQKMLPQPGSTKATINIIFNNSSKIITVFGLVFNKQRVIGVKIR
jgi:hypothetical protein